MEIQSFKGLSRTGLDKQSCHVLCSHQVGVGKIFDQWKNLPAGKKILFVPLQKSNPLCALKTDQFKKTDLDPTSILTVTFDRKPTQSYRSSS